MELGVAHWLGETLRAHPELAVFFALAVGFAVGPLKVWGFTLGNVTATLLAGVLIGQLGITVGGPIKSTFFLMFLFAVGFGVGPQFFRGLGREGPRQIVFSAVGPGTCIWTTGTRRTRATGETRRRFRSTSSPFVAAAPRQIPIRSPSRLRAPGRRAARCARGCRGGS